MKKNNLEKTHSKLTYLGQVVRSLLILVFLISCVPTEAPELVADNETTAGGITEVGTISIVSSLSLIEDQPSSLLSMKVEDVIPVGYSCNGVIQFLSSDLTLIDHSDFNVIGTIPNCFVQAKTKVDQFGSAKVTVLAQFAGRQASREVDLLVTEVQDAPKMVLPIVLNYIEDEVITPLAMTVYDPETSISCSDVGVISTNQALVPNANVTISGTVPNCVLSINPIANASGTTALNMSVSDGTSTTNHTLTLNIAYKDDAPTITQINDITVNEDEVTNGVSFTIYDEEAVKTCGADVVLSSSNTTLLPLGNIVLSGGATQNCSLDITPTADLAGIADITISVSDGNTTTNEVFRLNVNSINDAPDLGAIADVTTTEDIQVNSAVFNLSDVDHAVTCIGNLSASSSDTTVIANSRIGFSGTMPNCQVVLNPNEDAFGSSTITITANDGVDATQQTFLFTVNAQNDIPTLSPVADITIDEDDSTGVIGIVVTEVETPVNCATDITVASTNTTLVDSADFTFAGTAPNCTFDITPTANESGVATVTLSYNDGTVTVDEDFVLTVNSINDLPTLAIPGDMTKYQFEDTTGVLNVTITDVETALNCATDITVLSDNSTLIDDSSVVFGGTAPNCTAELTITNKEYGAATLTIAVSDGTTSTNDSLTVTVDELCTNAPNANSQTEFAFGDGTPSSPYMICNVFQLQKMNDDLDSSYELGKDIDASATTGWDPGDSYGTGFRAIGGCDPSSTSCETSTAKTPFVGTFNGNGYEISDLFQNQTATVLGLFGIIGTGASVQNVKLKDFDITSTRYDWNAYTGTLAGKVYSYIKDIDVIDAEVTSYYNPGGIAGIIRNGRADNVSVIGNVNLAVYVGSIGGAFAQASGARITNGYANTVLRNNAGYGGYAGGFIGSATNGSWLERIASKGSMYGFEYSSGGIASSLSGFGIGLTNEMNVSSAGTGWGYTGGIIGSLFPGAMLIDVYNKGSVQGANGTGGIVGYASSNVFISKARNIGDVSGSSNVGGIIGDSSSNGERSISQSFNKGDITGTSSKVGGLVGSHRDGSTISDSYSTGAVTGVNSVGGIAGYVYNSGIKRSFASGNVNATGSNAGGLFGYFFNDDSYESQIISSFSSGIVTIGGSHIGGLVGNLQHSATPDAIVDSYWFEIISDSTTNCYEGGDTGCFQETLVSDFYDANHPVYSSTASWDFVSTWIENPSTFPSLDFNNSATTTLAGSGTQADPYQISSIADWNEFTEIQDITLISRYFKLMNNLDFNGMIFKQAGKKTAFLGTLDGGGFDMVNINFDNGPNDDTGLISTASNATIKNLNLKNSTISATGSYAGGVVGKCTSCTLDNILIEGLTFTSRQKSGSLAGRLDTSTVTNITVQNSTITGSSRDVGGVVGYFSTGTMDNVSFDSTITNTSSNTGGIAGFLHSVNVSNLTVAGSVSSTSTYVGGVFGYVSGTSGAYNTATNLTNTATVSGTSSVGGIAAVASGMSFEKVSNTGNVTGQYDYIGGIAGQAYNSDFRKSFSSATITGTRNSSSDNDRGGFIGYASSIEVYDCYATGTLVNRSKNMGGFIGSIGGLSSKPSVIERVYSTVNISNNSYDYNGGLIGTSYVGSASQEYMTLRDSFYVGSVDSTKWAGIILSRFGTYSSMENTHYHLTGGSETYCYHSTGTLNCTQEFTLTNFYDKNHAVYSAGTTTWDFDNVWQENAGALPTLR